MPSYLQKTAKQTSYCKKKAKVTNLQNELQQLIVQAKSDYETRLVFNYAHTDSNKIFQYISSIKGRETYPVNMTYNSNCVSSDSDKYLITIFILYSPLLQMTHQQLILTTNQAHPPQMKFTSPILMSLTCLQLLMIAKHVVLTNTVPKYSSTVPYHYFK